MSGIVPSIPTDPMESVIAKVMPSQTLNITFVSVSSVLVSEVGLNEFTAHSTSSDKFHGNVFSVTVAISCRIFAHAVGALDAKK
jgi:hypothetical protein